MCLYLRPKNLIFLKQVKKNLIIKKSDVILYSLFSFLKITFNKLISDRINVHIKSHICSRAAVTFYFSHAELIRPLHGSNDPPYVDECAECFSFLSDLSPHFPPQHGSVMTRTLMR